MFGILNTKYNNFSFKTKLFLNQVFYKKKRTSSQPLSFIITVLKFGKAGTIVIEFLIFLCPGYKGESEKKQK